MRKLIIASLCCCLVFVSGFAAYRGYKIWKQKHLVKMARNFVTKGDAPNALLCLRQALQSNPHNLDACLMMADFAELARSPEAVLWRSRVVELQPHSLTNRLLLARTAMVAGDSALAQKTLDAVDEAGRKTPVFHQISGAVDLSAKRFADAETHFSEAARLEPDNPTSQLNLASLRIQKNDPQAAASARATLQALRTNDQARLPALRQLTQDALRHTNLAAAVSFSSDLLKDTNSAFSDRMLHLDLLRASTNAQQAAFLAELQRESTNNPAKAYELAKWMLAAPGGVTTDHGPQATSELPAPSSELQAPRSQLPAPGSPLPAAQATLTWLKTLPPTTRTNLPVPLIEADCYIATKNWTALQTNLANQSWFDLDCLRLACRTRAFKELGSATSAKTEWIATMKAAGARLELLAQLLNTVTLWNWPQEQEDVLWAVANRAPRDKAVVQALARRLLEGGRTRSLLTLYSLAVQGDRADLASVNNLAMTALLLEAWEKKPHDLAQEVYTKASTNSSFASTYAYSLLVQQKPAEALKVIEQLPAQDLEKPSIAGYYGMILKAAGNPVKAKKYFDLASKARLLPEEQKLLAQATSTR